MARRRLNKVVPVRVTHRDAVDLRRWARQTKDGNVSEVIRDLIEYRRQKEGQEAAA
jgi:hypothetical protein